MSLFEDGTFDDKFSHEQSTTIDDGTILTVEGVFKAYIKTQDSIEYLGSFRSKKSACEAWLDAQKFYNHAHKKETDMPFYTEEKITKRIAVRKN